MGSDPPILKGIIAVIGPLKKPTVICEYSVRFDQPKWKDYLKILFRLEFFQEMTFPFAIRISSPVPFPRTFVVEECVTSQN